MNSLSWLLYVGGVVDGLQFLIGAVFLIGGIGSVTMGIIGICEGEKPLWVYAAKGVFSILALGVVASFVPSKNTIYMIAASEMGQKAFEAQGTQEVLGGLQAIIKAELAKMKEKAK